MTFVSYVYANFNGGLENITIKVFKLVLYYFHYHKIILSQ